MYKGKPPVNGRGISSLQKLINMKNDEVVTKSQIYKRGTKSYQMFYVHVSKPVWQKNGSCKAVVVLDFAHHRKKNVQDTMWLIKVDVFQKLFIMHHATEKYIDGGYEKPIFQNINTVYTRRKHPGKECNDPWVTSKNGENQYHYRLLAGVMEFHGIEKDDTESFAAELDKLKATMENIKKDPDFQEEYTFAAYWTFIAKGLNLIEVLQKVKDVKNDMNQLYESGDALDSKLFHSIKTNFGKGVTDFMDKVPVVVNQDFSLDKIFLDDDAVHFGLQLYGQFTEKYKNILMKHPACRSRSFIREHAK